MNILLSALSDFLFFPAPTEPGKNICHFHLPFFLLIIPLKFPRFQEGFSHCWFSGIQAVRMSKHYGQHKSHFLLYFVLRCVLLSRLTSICFCNMYFGAECEYYVGPHKNPRILHVGKLLQKSHLFGFI